MPVKTKLVLNQIPVARPIEIQRKLAQMIADGKTDGELERVQENGLWITYRTWSDRAAAQEWIDFAPHIPRADGFVSVEIIED